MSIGSPMSVMGVRLVEYGEVRFWDSAGVKVAKPSSEMPRRTYTLPIGWAAEFCYHL